MTTRARSRRAATEGEELTTNEGGEEPQRIISQEGTELEVNENETNENRDIDENDVANLQDNNNRESNPIWKRREREERNKNKPMLKDIEGREVSKFLEQFKIYEEVVVRKRLKLPAAEIGIYLEPDVMAKLQRKNVALTRDEVIEYLETVKSQYDIVKRSTVMGELEEVKWENTPSIYASMNKYMKQIDSILEGVSFNSPSLEEVVCRKVLSKVPWIIRGRHIKDTIEIKGWTTIAELRVGLFSEAENLSQYNIEMSDEQGGKQGRYLTCNWNRQRNNEEIKPGSFLYFQICGE